MTPMMTVDDRSSADMMERSSETKDAGQKLEEWFEDGRRKKNPGTARTLS